jgi:hypothetical protein
MEIVIFNKGLFQNLGTYLYPRIFLGYVILPFYPSGRNPVNPPPIAKVNLILIQDTESRNNLSNKLPRNPRQKIHQKFRNPGLEI